MVVSAFLLLAESGVARLGEKVGCNLGIGHEPADARETATVALYGAVTGPPRLHAMESIGAALDPGGLLAKWPTSQQAPMIPLTFSHLQTTQIDRATLTAVTSVGEH